MKFFDDPLPENGGFLNALGARDSFEMLSMAWLQFDPHGRTISAHENGFVDFLQIVRELRKVVLIPEPSQLFNGIRTR